jgi:hypothetical protein
MDEFRWHQSTQRRRISRCYCFGTDWTTPWTTFKLHNCRLRTKEEGGSRSMQSLLGVFCISATRCPIEMEIAPACASRHGESTEYGRVAKVMIIMAVHFNMPI